MLLLNGKSDDAGRVMIELLGTYTTETASQVHYSTVQYNTVQYSTVQYNTVQYSTV